MASYNKTFELTIEDIDLIETALRDTKRSLGTHLIETAEDPLRPCEDTRGVDMSMKRINELLGRIHNQKKFYRPKTGAYIGG
ncbi:hypothetical protein ACG74X_10045 [Marivita sp. S0852]|uniref:hypothetical protein n=1 Tax=Marivita sp. S0852 TaxID=3373893 RepID=UPI003982A23F